MFELYVTFVKIGAFMFGGGYSMLPLLVRELVDRKKWCTEEEVLDYFSLAQCTPGVIAINSATFVGYKTAGVWGSLCATLGVVLPSFAIIALLGTLLDRFSGLKPVRYAFFGIRAGVLALIVKALLSMYKKCPKQKLSGAVKQTGAARVWALLPYLLMALAFILTALAGVSSLAALLLCAGVGLITCFLHREEPKA